MKKIAKAVFVFFIISFLCINFSEAQSKISQNFILNSLKGESVSLNSFRKNKSVLLLFWTTWCPFCRDQLLVVKDKYLELKKNNLELLAINIGESPNVVERFVNLRGLPYPVLLDRNSEAAKKFNVLGIPTYVLIDKNGNVLHNGNDFPDVQLKKLFSK